MTGRYACPECSAAVTVLTRTGAGPHRCPHDDHPLTYTGDAGLEAPLDRWVPPPSKPAQLALDVE